MNIDEKALLHKDEAWEKSYFQVYGPVLLLLPFPVLWVHTDLMRKL